MSQHYNEKHKPTGREFIDCLIKFRNTSEQMCLKCPKRWYDFTLLPFMTHATDALSCVIMANEYHVMENKNVSEENKSNHYKKLLKNFEKRTELLTQAIGKLKMVSVLFNCIEVKLNYEKEEFNKEIVMVKDGLNIKNQSNDEKIKDLKNDIKKYRKTITEKEFLIWINQLNVSIEELSKRINADKKRIREIENLLYDNN